MHISAALLIAMLSAGQSSPSAAFIPHCFLFVAEQVDLPPGEPGLLLEINVKPGDLVEENKLLMQVDDQKEVQEYNVAVAKLDSARAKAEDNVNIDYAIASEKVAIATLKHNEDANLHVPGSIPETMIDELRLKAKESALAIVKAKLEKTIAGFDANVGDAEVKAAKVAIERHKVYSRMEGVVVDVRKHRGEWVQPSEPVLKIVRLNRLWVEGYAPTSKYARAEFDNCSATVDVVVTRGQKMSFPGKVIFVRPTTETGDSFLVRVEVENRKVNGSWLLSPGLQGEMTVQLTTTVTRN